MANSCLAKSNFVTDYEALFFESLLAYLCKEEGNEEQTQQNGWAIYAMLVFSLPHVHEEKSSSRLSSPCVETSCR